MRIDLPLCDFRYCKFEFDGNCIAGENKREGCYYLGGNWISVSEELPKEYLCRDGKYDPSEYVLVQLDNEYMKVSRYWNHRHCKESIIENPWIDLEDWEKVIAWQPLPESWKGDS